MNSSPGEQKSPGAAATFTLAPNAPIRLMPKILVVTGGDALPKALASAFRDVRLVVARASTLAAACELASSGEFQLVISDLELADGSWKRLLEISRHCRVNFVIILAVRTVDVRQWAQVLEEGAFDVLDIEHDIPRVPEIAKRGLWAAYLMGAPLILPEGMVH